MTRAHTPHDAQPRAKGNGGQYIKMHRHEFPESVDVHNYDAILEQQHQLLRAAKLNPENLTLIQQFADFCVVDPKIGKARQIKYLFLLRRMGELIDKPFPAMTETDINALLARLQSHTTVFGRPYSPHTMEQYRKAISKFWRWMYYDEFHGKAPPAIRRLDVSCHAPIQEPDVYSKEEIQAITTGTTNPMYRAFLSCLYDLECRVSELLSRQVKHVRHTKNGDVQILIQATKTGVHHWETLFESAGHFLTWMRLHPVPDDPNAPLWLSSSVGADGLRRFQPLSYPATRTTFRRLCIRNGIRPEGPNGMHMLRKSKATHDMADNVPIPYIESRGSWAKGSKALRRYYLAVENVEKDNAYRQKYKIHDAVAAVQAAPVLKRCARCSGIVDNPAKFCPRCGHPTSQLAVIQADAERSTWDDRMARLIQDPEVARFLAAAARRLGISLD